MRAFWGECIWDVEYKSKYPDLVTFHSWFTRPEGPCSKGVTVAHGSKDGWAIITRNIGGPSVKSIRAELELSNFQFSRRV
jgi:hypothetical protein